MRSRFSFIIVLMVMMGFGLGTFYAIRTGWYPVAIVNATFVSARNYEAAVESVFHYYDTLQRLYGIDANELQAPQSVHEIRRATLDKFIENKIILSVLEINEIEKVVTEVADRIASLQSENPEFESAVAQLYGLDLERFKTLILEPQARQEVLEEVRFQDPEENSFADWIKNEREKASVFILARGLYWNGEQVILK
jgi:hypothetical protein